MEPATRRPPGLGEVIGRLLGETRQLVADYAELTILDARLAAIRLAWILGTVLVAAVLVVTSWMGLVAASIVFAWGHGASWPSVGRAMTPHPDPLPASRREGENAAARRSLKNPE